MTITIRDVARESGYSVSAVSQVLNKMPGMRLSDEAKAKITACAARLAYRPHPVALALRRQRSSAVSLILPDLSNPSFLNIAVGVQEELATRGYDTLIQHCGRDPDREQVLLKQAVERRVEGVVILAMNDPGYYGKYARLLPLLRISGLRTTGSGIRVDSVSFDVAGGFYKATNYLIKLGHVRIGLLNRYFDRLLVSRRKDGYIKALREHGVAVEPNRVLDVNGYNTEMGYKTGRGHREFLQGLTALLVYNDIMAIGLMKAVREAGMKIPEDISIIGCDGITWGEYSDPPLTTVCLPRRTAGQVAARMLLERIEGRVERNKGEEKIVQTSLIIRNSCKTVGEK